MRNASGSGWKRAGGAWLLCLLAFRPALAEERQAFFRGTTVHELTVLPSVPSEPNLYESYFGGFDDRIRSEYFERWHYHEMMLPYEGGPHRYEHFSMETWSGAGLREDDRRRQFANEVMRLRVDGALRAYFSSRERPASMRRTVRNAESVRNLAAELPLGKRPDSGRVQVRYDLMADEGRLEITRWGLSATVVGSRFFSGTSSLLTLQLSAELIPGRGSAYFSMNNENARVTSGFRLQLSALSADVIHETSLRGPSDQRYGVRLAFAF